MTALNSYLSKNCLLPAFHPTTMHMDMLLKENPTLLLFLHPLSPILSFLPSPLLSLTQTLSFNTPDNHGLYHDLLLMMIHLLSMSMTLIQTAPISTVNTITIIRVINSVNVVNGYLTRMLAYDSMNIRVCIL